MVDLAAERAKMLSALYADFGIDAVFTPAGGGAGANLRVRAERPREDLPLGEVGIESEKRRLRVRVSEIAVLLDGGTPRKGTFTLSGSGETLRVKRVELNPHRDEWRLGCEAVA